MSDIDPSDPLENIRLYDNDIKQTEARIKDLKERLEEETQNTDEADAVAKAKDALAIAQEDLMSVLKRKPEVNDLLEEIGAEKEVLKGQKFHLSNYLVAYFAQTQNRQVQMDEQGHARDVLLTAKLSKEEHQYQTSIFADKDGIHAGKVSVSVKE